MESVDDACVQWVAVLNNIGGSLGVLLGMAMFSFVEVVELFVDCILHVFIIAYFAKQAQNQPHGHQPEIANQQSAGLPPSNHNSSNIEQQHNGRPGTRHAWTRH